MLDCACPGSYSSLCDGSAAVSSLRRRPSNTDLIAAVEATKRRAMELFDEEVVRVASNLVSLSIEVWCVLQL